MASLIILFALILLLSILVIQNALRKVELDPILLQQKVELEEINSQNQQKLDMVSECNSTLIKRLLHVKNRLDDWIDSDARIELKINAIELIFCNILYSLEKHNEG